MRKPEWQSLIPGEPRGKIQSAQMPCGEFVFVGYAPIAPTFNFGDAPKLAGARQNVLIEASKKFTLFHEEKQTDKQYIPYPSSWLNAEGWSDETISSITNTTSVEDDLAPNVL